jgi:hypothetical protein
MRQDQYQRLQELEEKLVDVFLFEADPAKWPGAGIEPNAMDRDTRGDRYWCKKNPAATLALAIRVQGLIHQTQQLGDTPPPGAPVTTTEQSDEEAMHMDSEIARYEKQAAALLDTMTRAGQKAAFDARAKPKS